MRRSIQVIPLLAAVITGVAGAELHAQHPRRDPDAAEIAALLRTKGYAGEALEILTQVGGPRPRQTLDAIADTLAEIAISHPGNDIEDVQIRGTAVSTLMHAGMGNGGIPYPGAAERLLRIVETAPRNGGGALYAPTLIPNKAQALQFMRRVAISDSKLAYAAVGHLARNMGPEGLAVLRELHRQGLVSEPLARRDLAAVAKYHGWR